ncbi:hypothetical protein HII31_03518 [Pseudocercospora fuligena]|uniref:Uncharacterized protein n=1 Tax=Pseudocercospora fuligena TaxID=685502 RepID=A0A8H6VQD0_9PEZI|nr:hypothetical protein HII31_03518 [Pseudocercospora fuligena]
MMVVRRVPDHGKGAMDRTRIIWPWIATTALLALMLSLLLPATLFSYPSTETLPSTSMNMGIAFNLAFGYGTAAVYHANGTSVNVAKIEGSFGYKAMMRAQNWSMPQDDAPYDGGGWSEDLPHASFLAAKLGLLRKAEPDLRTKALSEMLHSLRTAMESYLGTRFVAVDVVFPSRPSSAMVRSLRLASSHLGVHLTGTSAGAGQIAAFDILGNNWDCDDPEKLIVTVEWSRAALTAMVYTEDCGIFEGIRGFQSFTLGSEDFSDSKRIAILRKLRDLVQTPTEFDSIAAFIVLGENGGDDRLWSMLRTAFTWADWGPAAIVTLDVFNGDIDPAFAAAGAAAKDNWAKMQPVEMHGCWVDDELDRPLCS